MARNTIRRVVLVAATVAGFMVAGAGAAVADHGDDDFGFDDHGRFDNRFLFDDRGVDCFGPGPICVVFDGYGGPGRH